MNDESLELVGTLYAAGARGYSAYEIAVQNGFSGTEEEWLESIVGAQGPIGPDGPIGPIGPTGLTPAIRIGTVTTVSPTTPASASFTGTPEVPILNLNIPQGVKGDEGATNYNELTNKPSINNVTLSGNLTLDDLNIQPKGLYVTTTDYATDNTGGVVKVTDGNGFGIGSTGNIYVKYYDYATYGSKGDNTAISKRTLENVITGKGLLSATNYATASTGGTVKLGNGFDLSSGKSVATVYNYATYQTNDNTTFISKGTLENVFTAKDFATKTYVDTLFGDINDALDALNGEVV